MHNFTRILFYLLFCTLYLQAAIHNVPSEYSTIQAALDASAENDTVIVAKGIYFENLEISGNIVLTSQFILDQDSSNIHETIINGDNAGTVIKIDYGVSNDCVIQYFTITNGFSASGAGIRIDGNPLIRGNIIENNRVIDGYGGGIYASSDSTIIYQNIVRYNSALDSTVSYSSGGGILAYGCVVVENEIYGNSASSRGGGIYGANFIARDNLIYENACPSRGAGIFVNIGDAEILNNVIVKNNGDGLYVWAAGSQFEYTDTITNNTIVGNSTSGITFSGKITSYVKNNIIWGNSLNQIGFIGEPIAMVSYNNIQNDPDSSGNISEMPLFNDTLNYRYELQEGSPGIDQGDPDLTYNDVCIPPSMGGDRNDIGAFGGPYACAYELPIRNIPVLDNEILVIKGSANIFGAGRETPPNPGGGGAGSLPVEILLPEGNNRFVTFDSIYGLIDCCNGTPSFPPDGGSGATSVASYNGISGITHESNKLFLTGVFLTDSIPQDPAPERMDATYVDTMDVVQTKIQQTFFIGDGRIRNSEIKQKFLIPDSASRFYIGILDAYGFNGLPGYFDDNPGEFYLSGIHFDSLEIINAIDVNHAIPTRFSLAQNYPNPFNPETVISYELATAGKVNVTLFDITGREIERLVDRYQNAGKYHFTYNARNLTSGVYIYRLTTGSGFSQSRKMILIK